MKTAAKQSKTSIKQSISFNTGDRVRVTGNVDPADRAYIGITGHYIRKAAIGGVFISRDSDGANILVSPSSLSLIV